MRVVRTVAFASCAALAVGCESAAAPATAVEEVVADSVQGFAGTQGANSWSYGYWDRSDDRDGAYDQAADFRLLPHFGSDPRNGLSARTEFTTGPLWFLQDGRFYTSLWATGGHPNANLELGVYSRAEQWAVRRWVSTIEGPVTIRGHVGKVMPWGRNWGGGCIAQIVVDGATVLRQGMDERGADYAIDARLRRGSLVDFLIGPNPSIGVTEFTATVRTAPAASR